MTHFRMLWGAFVSAVMVACEPGGVGDPCVPEDEYSPLFPGFALTEVNVESRAFSCETRICLVNHFQGRVTCPLGQEDPAVAGAAECTIPDTGEPVTRAVPAWDLDRPADRAVYCSCRCAGPDPLANYCECPSGFSCRDLVPDLRLGNEQLIGSYCVKNGTDFKAHDVGGPTCRTHPAAAVCDADQSP
jgi:hypothetical protein